MDEGKVGVGITGFDLEEFIIETTEDMIGLLKKEQWMEIEYEGGKLVHSDKKLLRNIINNLITNAIKFSNEGAEIRVSTKVENGLANISVIDKGIGIAKEDLDHLFSSFYRGTNAVNITGTGLGLHIVKRYTDLLQGNVRLQSDLDIGTVVTISIPVNQHEL